MTRDIIILRRAFRDLRRITNWLAKRSPKGADSWYRAFWAAASDIASDPERYGHVHEADDLTDPAREALFKTRRGKRYRIIFDFTETEVIILRIRQPGERPLRDRDLR